MIRRGGNFEWAFGLSSPLARVETHALFYAGRAVGACACSKGKALARTAGRPSAPMVAAIDSDPCARLCAMRVQRGIRWGAECYEAIPCMQ